MKKILFAFYTILTRRRRSSQFVCVCIRVHALSRFAWSTTCLNVTLPVCVPSTWNALHYTTNARNHAVIFGTRSLDRFRASFLIAQSVVSRVSRETEYSPLNTFESDVRRAWMSIEACLMGKHSRVHLSKENCRESVICSNTFSTTGLRV